jgi:hypothetical protein
MDDYIIELLVIDNLGLESLPVYQTIRVRENISPAADAGPGEVVYHIRTEVFLNPEGKI